jgi:hypothetical protein
MDTNNLTLGQIKEIGTIAKALGGACGAPKATAEQAERAVLVTTEFRGVFFGYATDTSGDVINLRSARNAVYWPAENKGFLGLAETGPLKGARIGPPADIELRKITCVAECTAPAIAAWEAAPWK